MHLSAHYNRMHASYPSFIYLFLYTQLFSGEHTKEPKITLKGLRATSICGCVTLNLHLLLNTHHPPLMPPHIPGRSMAATNGTPTKGRVRARSTWSHTRIDTCISPHTCRHRCYIYSRNTHKSEKGAKWGLSPRNLARLIRRATAKALPTPLI